MILGGCCFARPVMAIGDCWLIAYWRQTASEKLVSAFKDKLGQARWWTIFNGIVNLLLTADLAPGRIHGAVVLGWARALHHIHRVDGAFAPDKGVETSRRTGGQRTSG
jgi:hypothetical protein